MSDEPNNLNGLLSVHSEESQVAADDGPNLRVNIPREAVKRRAATLQKQLRNRIRRDARRYTDFILAVDAKGAGAMFDLSERAWRRLDVTGQVPAPIRVGRSVRWRLKELAAWVRAGCPDREKWEATRR